MSHNTYFIRSQNSPAVFRTPTPTPTPTPPPTSQLGLLAASMSPGDWEQLTVSNQNSVLGVGGDSGSMIHFCNSMPWNPVSKVIEIIGMDHNAPDLRHVRYDDATNQYVVAAASSGLGQAHGYDHNAVNPVTGDLYHRLYSTFTGHISVARKLFGGSSFSNIPQVTATDQNAIGVCWWSGSFTAAAGAGVQGTLMIFNSGNATISPTDGEMFGYNPLTDTWFFQANSKAPNYGFPFTYHSVMEYSAVHNVGVYGGGNEAERKLWRMNSAGSVLAMPDTPTGTRVGIQRGLLTVDPVSGNFLLLSSGQFWELDPTGSGTWTQLTNPPSGVGNPTEPTPLDGMICCSIPDYGVVVFIKQTSGSGGTTFVYKHA